MQAKQPILGAHVEMYNKDSEVSRYASDLDLQPPERAALDSIDGLGEARLLDIGVGAGRTTRNLHDAVGHYVGLDYAEAMARAARRTYPDTSIHWSDARYLQFRDTAFDVVLMSFNAIDEVGHDDRLAILAEVHRVLVDGGTFVFSSHNRERGPAAPWVPRTVVANPKRAPREARIYLHKLRSYWKARRRHVETDEYAILSDDFFAYQVQMYFIDRRHQVAQLERAGFADVAIWDQHGRQVLPGDDTTDSAWLYYRATKPTTGSR